VRAVVEGMASDMHLGRVGASMVIYVKQRVGFAARSLLCVTVYMR
jgi:hypothetical protein